jgi:Right handed beta helix region
MGTRRQIENDERCKPMQTNAADIRCPNCASVIEVLAPIEPSRWSTWFREEVPVTCSRCGWECTVDSNAEISDDGEAAVEWELELDVEGELIDAREELSPFTQAEIRQLEFDEREWSHSDDDYQIQWARTRGPASAICPNCSERFREAWLGEIRCASCDWLFRVDRDAPDGEDDEDGDPYDDEDEPSPAPQSIRKPGKTLVVSPGGSEGFNSITGALRQAAPGTRILVKPGMYEEEISVGSSVEIVGDGPLEQIIIEGRNGPALTLNCESAVVRGLTIRGMGGMDGRRFPAVELVNGTLEECDITSDSLACVHMLDGILRCCRIHNGENAGIVGRDGSIIECELFQNAEAAIVIERAGEMVVRDCRVFDGYGEGIVVDQRSCAAIARCDIFGNRRAEIALRGERALIRDCRIHGGESEGILVEKNGAGTVETSEIVRHSGHGVAIRSGNLVMHQCQIQFQQGNGLDVSDSSVSWLEDCVVSHNSGSGAAIRGGASPYFLRCRIQQNECFGVSIHSAGAGFIEECDLSRNSQGPWDCEPSNQVRCLANLE